MHVKHKLNSALSFKKKRWLVEFCESYIYLCAVPNCPFRVVGTECTFINAFEFKGKTSSKIQKHLH